MYNLIGIWLLSVCILYLAQRDVRNGSESRRDITHRRKWQGQASPEATKAVISATTERKGLVGVQQRSRFMGRLKAGFSQVLVGRAIELAQVLGKSTGVEFARSAEGVDAGSILFQLGY